MGGQLTDLCGDPLSVYEGGPSEGGPSEGCASALLPVPPERRNELGFVATGRASAISHRELIRRPGHTDSNIYADRRPSRVRASLPPQAARNPGADAVPRRRGAGGASRLRSSAVS